MQLAIIGNGKWNTVFYNAVIHVVSSKQLKVEILCST